MNNEVYIALSTDNSYAAYLSTTIFSIKKNRNFSLHYFVYIFYTELSSRKINLLKKLSEFKFEISFINIKKQIENCGDILYTKAHYSKEVYYRFFMPEHLKDKCRYLIYLDSDLVVNCDISTIMDGIDRRKTINGVINYSTQCTAKRITKMGILFEKYINAGVMVIDCIQFQRHRYKDAAIEFLSQNKNLVCLDQDALNYICFKDIGYLDVSWNVQWHNLENPEHLTPFVRNLVQAIDVPKIIHFTSSEKPWNNPTKKYSDLFFSYAIGNPIYNDLLNSN